MAEQFKQSLKAENVPHADSPGVLFESAQNIEEVAPKIRAMLERHITDLPTLVVGNRELGKGMGDVSYGVKKVSINRAIPPIEISSVLLPRRKSKVLVGPNGAGKSTFFDAITERDEG